MREMLFAVKTVPEINSWHATMWGPAIVMVHVVRPSVCLSHVNISETKRDGRVVTVKHEWELGLTVCHPIRDQ